MIETILTDHYLKIAITFWLCFVAGGVLSTLLDNGELEDDFKSICTAVLVGALISTLWPVFVLVISGGILILLLTVIVRACRHKFLGVWR
jgi:uncharacterized membrane protein